jgi:sugar/nucleoside kinase (ribokinase family)
MSEVSNRIVVFGDVIDDIIARPSGGIRQDTDTPSSIERRAGGSAANTATWLAHAGAEVDFVGRVGVVDLERHSHILSRAGVKPMLAGDHLLPTGTIVIIVEGDSRTMLTERGANAVLDPDAVSDAVLDGASALHFTGYSLFGRKDVSGFHRLIKRARAKGVQVSVDPGSAGFLEDFGVKQFIRAISGATIIFPSLDEGRALTGLEEPERIVEALVKSFPVVALTMGVAGVLVGAAGEASATIPIESRDTVDPTGAGDAFCAGFLHAWMQTGDIESAARAGAELAASAVEIIGGRPRV